MNEGKNASLRDHPELAAEIGYFIANFNMLEAIAYMALSTMIGDKGQVARAILSGVDSIAYKLGVVFSLAELNPKEPLAAELHSQKELILRAVKFRNKIAHGVYAI